MAHYDGQGLAGDGSHYPGANDNASGVGVMLEVASELARRQSELPISVVFAALGAEEIGMRGASELVQHPPIPLERVALAVNLDMEGAGDGSLTVQTTSADMPAYRRLTALASRRNITTKPYVRTQLGADADVVQAAGVPTLFIVTGGTEHHTVHDDMSNVSRQTMANVTGLLEEFIAGYAG